MLPQRLPTMLASLLLLGALPAGVLAGDVLKTDGFSTCSTDADIQITTLNVEYDRTTKEVVFDVAGTSSEEQEVMASLTVEAYGKTVYSKTFNPCNNDTGGTYVKQLCPVPAGSFSATGSETIPDDYASEIPAVAFTIPDLDGLAKLQLTAINDTSTTLACIESTVSNGKTTSQAAVSYVAAGIAGAALLMSGVSALSAAGAGAVGGVAPSPTFTDVMGWFQSMAMNGMLSVQYPTVYQSFSRNFAFAGGLIPWESMQTSIDNFRNATGGNLTEDSVAYLKQATLVDVSDTDTSSKVKRAILEGFDILARSVDASYNETTSTNTSTTNSTSSTDINHYVKDIQAFAEKISIPQANIFMTALLIFAILVAAIAVGILLFKVILETWALFGNFPERLTDFRKRYWWLLARTITNLILLLYGIWVLYCIYQFTNGDSWAAKLLAGFTLFLFTAVLGFFTFRIWQIARKYQKMEGDPSGLFEDQETWRKYSLFYENYKRSYWWLFVPTILYSFAKGCVIAGANGHGLAQTSGQLIIESLLLILLLWARPYTLKSSNVINIIIQVVRVLSVVCILVFVEELGISQTTKTVTGIVLVVVQSVLTGALAILIAVNSIITCCKENPHKKRIREAEKLNRDLDNLTPLDARNSLLMDPSEYKGAMEYRGSMQVVNPMSPSHRGYNPVPLTEVGTGRPVYDTYDQRVSLLNDAASMGHGRDASRERSASPPRQKVVADRAPRLPDISPSGGHL